MAGPAGKSEKWGLRSFGLAEVTILLALAFDFGVESHRRNVLEEWRTAHTAEFHAAVQELRQEISAAEARDFERLRAELRRLEERDAELHRRIDRLDQGR